MNCPCTCSRVKLSVVLAVVLGRLNRLLICFVQLCVGTIWFLGWKIFAKGSWNSYLTYWESMLSKRVQAPWIYHCSLTVSHLKHAGSPGHSIRSYLISVCLYYHNPQSVYPHCYCNLVMVSPFCNRSISLYLFDNNSNCQFVAPSSHPNIRTVNSHIIGSCFDFFWQSYPQIHPFLNASDPGFLASF